MQTKNIIKRCQFIYISLSENNSIIDIYLFNDSDEGLRAKEEKTPRFTYLNSWKQIVLLFYLAVSILSYRVTRYYYLAKLNDKIPKDLFYKTNIKKNGTSLKMSIFSLCCISICEVDILQITIMNPILYLFNNFILRFKIGVMFSCSILKQEFQYANLQVNSL